MATRKPKTPIRKPPHKAARTLPPKRDKAVDAPITPRGADELEFLKSRAESTPLDRATIHAHLEGLRSRVTAGRRQRGREAHETGTVLKMLYMRHADAVLGLPHFSDLIDEHWPDAADDAYGSMIIAHWLNATQAEEYGYWKALYGIRLAKKLGLTTFDALEGRELGKRPDGTAMRFADLSVTEVKALSSRPPVPELERPGEKAGRAVFRLRGRAKTLVADNPEFAALKTRIFVQDGEATVSVTSTGKQGAEAARRFLQELWR